MVQAISKTVVTLGLVLFCSQSIHSERTYQYSSFPERKELYLDSIKKAPQRQWPFLNGKRITCGIVTHHFLASDLMVEFFQGIESSGRPDRIILIGPDHYRKGINTISLSDIPWKTPFGILETDKETISGLEKKLDITLDHEAFSNEHSIGILVPFIKYFFPNTRLVPIIIRGNITQRDLDKLYDAISVVKDDKTLLILSSDFSHGKPSAEAKKEDVKSEKVILGKAYNDVWELDDDCRPGLHLILRYATDSTPKIVAHTNSAEIAGKDVQNCTSYFTVLFLEDRQ